MRNPAVVGGMAVAAVLSCFVLAATLVRAETQNAPANAASSAPQDPKPDAVEKPIVPRELLLELFHRNTVPATDFESVVENYGHRSYNIRKAFPERDDYQRVIMDFVNIRRPKVENDILVSYGEELLALEDDGAKGGCLIRLLGEIQHYSSDDMRLFQIARRAIASAPKNRNEHCRIEIVKQGVVAIGMIRVHDSSHYLQNACQKSYWEQVYKDLIEAGELHDYELSSFQWWVLRGITNLPEEEAIPLLEGLFIQARKRGLDNTNQYFRNVFFCLDEMWRRKYGMPSIHTKGGLRHDFAVHPLYWEEVAHPEFLFGLKGERIPKPFGEGPETYQVHVDLFGI